MAKRTVRRPCLDCGQPSISTRCPAHTKDHEAKRWQAKLGRYNGDWRAFSRQAIADHVARHGMVCPGWDTAPHQCTSFVCDHDVGPLCSPCNGRKAATFDKR